jgi:hypothetical protein
MQDYFSFHWETMIEAANPSEALAPLYAGLQWVRGYRGEPITENCTIQLEEGEGKQRSITLLRIRVQPDGTAYKLHISARWLPWELIAIPLVFAGIVACFNPGAGLGLALLLSLMFPIWIFSARRRARHVLSAVTLGVVAGKGSPVDPLKI